MPNWLDTTLVAIVIGGALFYVGREVWARIRSASAPRGDGCAGCDAHGSEER